MAWQIVRPRLPVGAGTQSFKTFWARGSRFPVALLIKQITVFFKDILFSLYQIATKCIRFKGGRPDLGMNLCRLQSDTGWDVTLANLLDLCGCQFSVGTGVFSRPSHLPLWTSLFLSYCHSVLYTVTSSVALLTDSPETPWCAERWSLGWNRFNLLFSIFIN